MTDARRIGMGGLSLTIDGRLTRYNPAYGAVPSSAAPGGAKATIPLPFGLVQFFHDHPISTLSKDPLFNPDSAAFNPVAVLDLFLNPPIFYQVTTPPEPTNNVAFGVGRDSFQINLGASQALVPAGEFGINGSSRPLSIEPSFAGFKVGAMLWLDDQVDLQLGDSLLALLKNAHPAAHLTQYDVTANALIQGGFAPTVGWAGRVAGNDQKGFYLGASLHYYFGVAYGNSTDQGGFTTGNTIFGGSNPLTPNFTGEASYSKWGNSFGHGVGGDVGFAWVSGPILFGVGVNDIGATLTWPDSRVDFVHYDTTQSKIVTDSSHLNVQTTSKLPVSYLANVIYTLGGTTVGADIFSAGQGTELHLGAEQRFGPFALRGGLERDEQKILQFAFGGGLRFGIFSLDVGFWTQSYSLSGQRSLTMATSISIY
ncbi:MAG TPA: hypothetical protein VN848_07845 [Gemmatimonadales bacterium]|nr:hypothetical protein [Gemmatimonadales bacterium]